MKNNNIIERLIMSIILSDLDPLKMDNLTGAIGLLRQAAITTKNLAQVLATISQVTGAQAINQ
ncbi:hypothetical protein [Shewanella indica]|uniref:hypothetical protein n=1 Tax=Shewanella indica TaxID=768528 RepID=UPI0020440C30|nr:hypothetical protein [Shewanella indica]